MARARAQERHKGTRAFRLLQHYITAFHQVDRHGRAVFDTRPAGFPERLHNLLTTREDALKIRLGSMAYARELDEIHGVFATGPRVSFICLL